MDSLMSASSLSSEQDEESTSNSSHKIMTPLEKRFKARKFTDDKKRAKTYLNSTTSIEKASPMRKAQVRLSKINVMAIKQESKIKQICITDDFLEKYEEIDKIGEGANGVIFRARGKEDLNKFFAVKKLRCSDQELLEIERNEFNILRTLDHINILKVYEIYHNESQGIIRIVSELLEGMTLKQYLQKKGPLTIKKAQIVFKSVLSALSYLHKKGVCHRDIKPSNIMISEDLNDLRLIDFGVAKYFKKEENKGKNGKVTMMTPTGSEFYKAPEFMRGGVYDEKIDIWACGVTLFEMVIGQNPVIELIQSKCKNWTTDDIFNSKAVLKSTIWDQEGSGALKLLLKYMLDINSDKRLSAKEAENTPFFLFHDVQKISQLEKGYYIGTPKSERGDSETYLQFEKKQNMQNSLGSIKNLSKPAEPRSMSLFNPMKGSFVLKKKE